ncbi:MAG: bifunctional precorrin-2 dehydrogenase/sirohydrochlorin ferrochelatase [Bacilli bacterium]|uniref:precorrin-2 dehydrogenase/sirohydrochlorin ferrochelatase family protein n=1 Tax=Ureibacillus sp. FSL W7-1570 TaxID=2954593 RepID=UPI001EB43074|nr:siroheme synthase [Bacilli bacterium]
MYYPMMMKLEGKKVVIIGGGRVAFQKLKGLENTKAKITVVSPTIIPEMEEWLNEHDAIWIQKEFEPSDIEQADLIFATTNDPKVNQAIGLHKKGHQLLLRADHPKESDFITPAVVQRGKLTISISTDGASPGLSKKIKKELEQQFDENFGEYVQFLEDARRVVLKQIGDASLRKSILTRLLDPVFYELTMERKLKKRDHLLMDLIKSAINDDKNIM